MSEQPTEIVALLTKLGVPTTVSKYSPEVFWYGALDEHFYRGPDWPLAGLVIEKMATKGWILASLWPDDDDWVADIADTNRIRAGEGGAEGIMESATGPTAPEAVLAAAAKAMEVRLGHKFRKAPPGPPASYPTTPGTCGQQGAKHFMTPAGAKGDYQCPCHV